MKTVLPKVHKNKLGKPKNMSTNLKKEIWNTRRKKGRLIVRNLPFKITDEQFRQHFLQFGEIKDIKLLKRPDGKLIGCGFVEYTSKENASQAIAATSGKPLLNRPIIVDWAIPKDIFCKKDTVIKSEVKEEKFDTDEEEEEVLRTTHSKTESDEDSDMDSNDESDEASDDDQSEISEVDSVDSDEKGTPDKKRKFNPPERACDVKEGCTVFLKNVPFTATSEELKKCMQKFGPVVYALICTDPLTEHSRGSAFVKFQKKESADACIKSGSDELKLGVNVLEPHIALEKQQLQEQATQKKSENKNRDGRNLYLVKEGVVTAGSVAAKGVSNTDMGKRLKLEQWKTQMLRNLSMVISRTRLAVHNLPPTLTDEGLRNILKKHSPAGAKIIEARVMRDLRQVDAQQRGLSKEFGFVTFTQHSDALSALRAINNNPSIFKPQKRPIVGFSIENKAVLNAKQRRLEMSRHKNPYFQKDAKTNQGNAKAKPAHSTVAQTTLKEDPGDFAGIEAHSGQTIKLPNRGTLRSQASVHRANVQQEKKKLKLQRKIAKERNNRINHNKELKLQKMSRKSKGMTKNEDHSFDQLVNKYKEKLEKTFDVKKWYE
ncbi:hypothetical protein B566_EDAN015619 [Ephemera danica]|nr:hypothetical protein B566_EDAN015619 [Ephemera danica]